MDQHLYVAEKLKELERGMPRRPVVAPSAPAPSRRWVGRPVAAVGRRIRGAGEALESWAQPCPGEARP